MNVFSASGKRGVLYTLILVGIVTFDVHQARSQEIPNAPVYQQQVEPQEVPDEYDISWDNLRKVDEPMLKDTDQRRLVRLTVQDCIVRALEHNLDLRTGSYDPAIRLADITKLEAAFDAVLVASAQFENIDRGNIESGFYTRTIMTKGGTDTVKIPTDPFTRQQDYNYMVGLQKRLPTGASIEFAQRLRRLHTGEPLLYLDTFYESSLDLVLRQPLLRDFGIDVNRASINAARNNFGIGQQQFHLLAIQTMAEVEINYWTLVYYRQRVNIYEQLLDQVTLTNKRLIARTTHDAAAGMISRSQGIIATTEADLLSARNDLISQQDRLLESINDPNLMVGQMWELIPLDEPTTLPYGLDRENALELALEKRPELKAQHLAVDTTEIALGLARNQLKPRLDLVARQEINGPGGKVPPAWEAQNNYNTVNYLFGLSFELPLGNRAARANLVKAEYERQQEKLRLENFREQIRTDVTISWENLESAHQEIAARLKSADYHGNTLKARLALEKTDAKIDASHLFLKLDAQERLARAYDILAQTIFQYNTAIIGMQRAQGTLLQYNNIKLAESPQKKHTIK